MKLLKSLFSNIVFLIAVTILIPLVFLLIFWVSSQLPRFVLSIIIALVAVIIISLLARVFLKRYQHYTQAKREARAREARVAELLAGRDRDALVKQLLNEGYSYGRNQGESALLIGYNGEILHSEMTDGASEFWILEHYLLNET